MPDTATYTHGHAESVLRSHRTRTAENSAAYLLPYLRAGLSLLDIGSGPGTITADLAERVAPGPVTAVEVTEAALAATRAEFERRGRPPARAARGTTASGAVPGARPAWSGRPSWSARRHCRPRTPRG